MRQMQSPFNPDDQAGSIESRMLAAMERISQAFRVLLWNQGKAWDLSPIQVQILIFLHFHPESRRKISYLAREFNMTKATISESISTLEKKSIITREGDPLDSRSHIINLTEKGIEIAGQAAFFANAVLEPLKRLSEEDKKQHIVCLLDILRYLQITGVISMDRMCYTCEHFSENYETTKHYCRHLDELFVTADLQIDCPHHMLATL